MSIRSTLAFTRCGHPRTRMASGKLVCAYCGERVLYPLPPPQPYTMSDKIREEIANGDGI